MIESVATLHQEEGAGFPDGRPAPLFYDRGLGGPPQYRYATYPWYLTLIIVLGQGCAFLGVFAAFWHVSWIAGILPAGSGIGGLLIYIVYLRQMERDNAGRPASGAAKE